MCSLASFPLPPPQGYVTVCERNAELVASVKGESDIVQNLGYPEVDVTAEFSQRNAMAGESARSAFLEHQDTPRKRLMRAWYEQGLTGVLEELASNNASKDHGWLAKVCSSILGVVRGASSLHGSLFPHLALSNEDLIAEFSQHNTWKLSDVRCFAWHPHTVKFAVAVRDDSIKVYTAKRDIVPVLKHKMQKGVAALAWKPLSASLLAVGCQSCVLLWNVDPTSLATRPSTSAVQVLSQPGHAPVTSLAWCPQGGVLVSASPADSAIMVWDDATERCVTLRRVGGGGVSLLHWSPEGSKLLAACPSSLFRVWETKTWTCEKWSKLAGRCKAACWSPSGNVLLFATADEPIIYSLTFSPGPDASASAIGGSKVAVACVDLSLVEMETEDGIITVGGRVQNMVWDPTGERVAVQFAEGSPELIALFQTRLQPMLELLPCGFIRGHAGEIPSMLSFQPQFEKGALLTVVWSSGRVSYTPLYFVLRQAVRSQQIYMQQQQMDGNQSGLFSHLEG